MAFLIQISILSILAIVNSLSPTLSAASTASNCNLRSVCYALDQSTSINGAEYGQLNEFTVQTARILKMISPTTAFSAARFANISSLIQPTTADLDGVFVPAIENANKIGGGTNIYSGLQACFDELKKTPSGGAKLIILVTDGQGSSGTSPVQTIKDSNIAVMTVGVGKDTDVGTLKNIATKPEFYTDAATFTNLVGLGSKVVNLACELVTIINVTPAPTPITPTPAPMRDYCQIAFDTCNFKFRNYVGVPTFNANGEPDTPFSTLIVSKNPKYRIGALNMNNLVPEFIGALGAKPITEFGVQPFSPTQFKPFGSYIGHETYQGNQATLVGRRCVCVYFSSYQVLNSKGHVVSNMNNVPKSAKKCVVFRTV